MFVALCSATQSTLPCQVMTWNVGTFDWARIGNSTEVYEQNGMKIAATFFEIRFWTAVFMTSGSWALVSTLTSSSGCPPTPPAALICSIASSWPRVSAARRRRRAR